jgi:CRP-like cAMP-binding protein
MGRQRVRHTLDDHPLFVEVGRRPRRAYARHAEQVSLAPGTVLLREGREPTQVTYLRGGRAEVSQFGVPLGEVGPGQAVGADALARLEVSDVTVTAVTMVDAVVLHRRAFRGAWRALPAVRAQVEFSRGGRLAPSAPSR